MKDIMDQEKIIIPEGWTYFKHRTNTARWNKSPFDESVITINKLMSVVTERDIYQELRHYGQNHLQGYSIGSGEPFEIRCLICGLSYLNSMNANNELKEIMLKEFYYDRRNFGGCCGQRHHSIPKGEELVVIGIGNHDMIYFDKNSTNRCFAVSETNIPFWQELKETDNIYVSEIPRENATISKLVVDDEIDVTSLNLPINHYWNGEPEEEFEDYIKMIEDLSINTEKFNILLCHSPKNIGKDTIIKEYYDILKKFNLILSGHMHSGLIPRWLRTKPYGKGLVGPYNTIFPEYAYGTKNFDDTTILTTGGVTKSAQSVGPEVITTNYLFRNLVNLVYPPEVELIKIEGKEKILQYK